MTPETTALIDKMLCGDGIPKCMEWTRLESHARELERKRDELRAMLNELREVLEKSTAARRDQSSEIGDLTHNLVMTRSMLRSLVNGWQSDMGAKARYDELVWEARALLDKLDGLESP